MAHTEQFQQLFVVKTYFVYSYLVFCQINFPAISIIQGLTSFFPYMMLKYADTSTVFITCTNKNFYSLTYKITFTLKQNNSYFVIYKENCSLIPFVLKTAFYWIAYFIDL